MITPLPGATPAKPGSCTLPLPGIAAAIVDETGADVEQGNGGFLVIKRPWPAMIRNIWGDPERFKKSYFPSELRGYYLAGDGAQRDADGYFWIMGRIDDVLNVSGHRLGTMEVESALVAHELVAEAAVVGRPDDTTGEAVVAFVVPARAARGRRGAGHRQAAARLGGRDRPHRQARTSASATTCPRRVPARSCAACCAWSPRARKSPRTCPRWKTPPSWINWPSRCRSDAFRSRPPPVRIVDETAGGGPRRAPGADARNGIRYGRLCFPIPIHLESPQ